MARKKKSSPDYKTVLAPSNPLSVELIQINKRIADAVLAQDEVEMSRALDRLQQITDAADFDPDVMTGEERAAFCWHARVAGYTDEAIAKLLRKPGGNGKRIVSDAIKWYRGQMFDPQDDVKSLRMELYDRTMLAVRALLPKVLEGNTEATKVFNQILQTQSRLGGLDVQKQLHGLMDSEGREVSMLKHPMLAEQRLLPEGSEDDEVDS